MKHTGVPHLLFIIFLVSGLISVSPTIFAQQNDCPRIYKAGDTLKTDPAPTYQWYKNDVAIPNATQQKYRPDTSGNYTVAVGATSAPTNVVLNPADLRVDVFDTKLKPVANATVSVNGQSATTNADGRAFIPNVVSGRTVIKVTANQYFDGYTSTYQPASGNAIAKIQLERMPAGIMVNTENGGVVASSTGLQIKFAPNSFINESTGQAYNGTVTVHFSHRAPENDPMFSFAMPGGDFTALDQNGELVALTSYGFFNAELRGANGEELNLQPGTTAAVQFRIPENMRADAPATVPLWYFDEAAGIWKYDSELTKSGMFYRGQVSHFSSWNCDYYGPRCTVVASVVDCAGNPAANALIYLNQICGFADANGNITFINAPADIPITLTTLQETINIGIVGEGNTYTLTEPLQTSDNILGAFIVLAEYWQDSVEIYTFGIELPVQYSLDGQNWQSEPLFTNVPLQDSVVVWLKTGLNCPIIQKVVYYTYERAPYLCYPPQNLSQIEEYSFIVNNLPPGNTPIYKAYGYPGSVEYLAYVCGRYSCIVELHTAHSNLNYLPAEIGNLSSLKKLNLYDNQITSLPAEIGNLTSLQNMFLSYNQLTTLPAEIGNLTNLEYLLVTDNQLSTLPAEIGNLSSLNTLDLQYNQLSTLPAEIGNLGNLQWLMFNNNQLSTLPAEIGNLGNLHTLELQYNQLSSIPGQIANLSKLHTLKLHSNQLSTLPGEIGNFAYLQSLGLDNNQLTSLPAEIGNLSYLQLLTLNDNQLTALPVEIANLADTLQVLSLSGNPIPVQDRPYYQSLLPNTAIYWE